VDTRELKQILGEAPIDSIEDISWMKSYVEENAPL
jgi:hypothetical protein